MSEVARDDADDYDLLTYGEAGVRLQEEIVKEQARLDGLSGYEADAVGQRIEALRDSARPNARRPYNDETFERFFGFPARRQTRP